MAKMVKVYAPVKHPMRDGVSRKIVIYDRHELHPGGEVFIAEGDGMKGSARPDGIEVFDGSIPIREAITRGRLKVITKAEPAPDVKDAVPPDELLSLGLKPNVVTALGERGVYSVTELVAKINAGLDLETIDGIGINVKRHIMDQLAVRGDLPAHDD